MVPETKMIFNNYLWDGEWKSDVKVISRPSILARFMRATQIRVFGLLRPVQEGVSMATRWCSLGTAPGYLPWMPWKPRFYHLQLFFTWSFLHSHLTHKHSPPEGSGVLGRYFCSTPFCASKFSPMFHGDLVFGYLFSAWASSFWGLGRVIQACLLCNTLMICVLLCVLYFHLKL